MAEIIPIPEEKARNKRPIHIECTPNSFPERFAIRMDWNDYYEKWVIEIEHIARDERITKSTATPYRTYSYMPYVTFSFLDPSGDETEVTPENLGDQIQLFAFPGPNGQPPSEW